MQAILSDRINVAKAVNVQVISLDAGPDAYGEFDAGVAKKFVIDPHGLLKAASDLHAPRCRHGLQSS